jgi:hypothetical protein
MASSSNADDLTPLQRDVLGAFFHREKLDRDGVVVDTLKDTLSNWRNRS